MEKEEREEGHVCHVGGISGETRDRWHRIPIPEQDPKVRATNFDEAGIYQYSRFCALCGGRSL